MSQLFTSGGQSIRASASVLPMNIQGWFPLGLTGLISMLSEGLARSSPAPQFKSINSIQGTLKSLLWYHGAKHQSFSAQSFLRSNSHICTWLLRLLILLPALLVPVCASSSLAFHIMYSSYKLNKQGDNIQLWCTPFPIWNHSIVPCLVLELSISHYWKEWSTDTCYNLDKLQ